MTQVDTNLSNLIINRLTQSQYDNIQTLNPNEFYIITDGETTADKVTNQNTGSIKFWSGVSSQLGNSMDSNTIYYITDTKEIYKGSTLIYSDSDKVSTSDIWYDSNSSTLNIGVSQS